MWRRGTSRMVHDSVGKLGRGKGNIFRSVWDNWSASFRLSESRCSFGHTAGVGVKEGWGKRGFGPWAGLVPIRLEAQGRFICTGRVSQRRTEGAWCCSSQPNIEGVSAAVPQPILPFHPLLWNQVQKGLLNCLWMFSVYVLLLRSVPRVPVRALCPTVLETAPCHR